MVLFKKLSLEHLDDIALLETSWPTPLRASADKIKQRLLWNHVMLGSFEANRLTGIAAWRYDSFDPARPMPPSFDTFANRPNGMPHNAAYVYNFAIAPSLRNSKRGLELAFELIAEGISMLIAHRCSYLVGASRCPSYAGNNDPLNRYNQSIELQSAIDNYQMSNSIEGTLPWQQDPILSFYKHALDCTFNQVIPKFMPADVASGGYAIGFYKHLGKIHEV